MHWMDWSGGGWFMMIFWWVVVIGVIYTSGEGNHQPAIGFPQRGLSP